MASSMKIYKVRKKLKARKQGRARKNKLTKYGSTPKKAVVFGDTKGA